MFKRNIWRITGLLMILLLTGCQTKETAKSETGALPPGTSTEAESADIPPAPAGQPDALQETRPPETEAAAEETFTPPPAAPSVPVMQTPAQTAERDNTPAQTETAARPPETERQQNTDGTYLPEEARQSFEHQNERRREQGTAALVWNDALYESAKIRAAEIVKQFSHTRPDGSSCFTAVSGQWRNLGENIAYGQRTAQEVTQAWYDSEGHRRNMLREVFTSAAVACYEYQGKKYWVTIFGE